jgi:PleD family two-component response regulator
VVARWGGEAFVLLLPRTSANAAGRIAERLRLAIAGTAVEIGDDLAVQLTGSSSM